MQQNNPFTLRVLTIDDERDNNMAFLMAMEDFWEVEALESPEKLTRGIVSLDTIDAIFLDLVFNEDQSLSEKALREPSPLVGLATLDWIRHRRPNLPVFLISALPEQIFKRSAQARYKNVFYLQKPCLYDQDFRVQVEAIVKERRAVETN